MFYPLRRAAACRPRGAEITIMCLSNMRLRDGDSGDMCRMRHNFVKNSNLFKMASIPAFINTISTAQLAA